MKITKTQLTDLIRETINEQIGSRGPRARRAAKRRIAQSKVRQSDLMKLLQDAHDEVEFDSSEDDLQIDPDLFRKLAMVLKELGISPYF